MEKLSDFENRQLRLMKKLAKSGRLPYLLTHLPDIRYLTGFSGTEALVILCDDGVVFGTDGRYMTQARNEVTAHQIHIYARRKTFFRKWLRKRGKVYFDRRTLPFSMYEELLKMGYEPVPEKSAVGKLRVIKDHHEVEHITKAAIIATTSFLSVFSGGADGLTERDFAASLEYEMKKRGAEGVSFPPIVAAGENAARPHAFPGDRVIGEERVVLFDFGCRVEGYCSDETITLGAFSKSSWSRRKVFDAVRKALEAAVSVVRPGVRCRDIDKKAREVLDGAGLLKYFPHATGHGVGLEVHEPPSISPYSRDVLREGMIITVEPGVYIPGEGGVRFEDLLLVTDRGGEKLTYFPKTGVFPGDH